MNERRSRLTREQVEAVKYGLEKGMSPSEIKKLTGVSYTSIARIRDGEHPLCRKDEPIRDGKATATVGEVMVHNLMNIGELLAKCCENQRQIIARLEIIDKRLDTIERNTQVVADDLLPEADK